METTLNDKIYEALQTVDDGSRYREVVAEIMTENVPEDEDNSAIESIDEEMLLNRTSDIKKLVAAARKIAKATGDGSIREKSPYEMAAMADDAVERAKQATLYANGEIEYEEMSDRLIDRTEARLLVVADAAIDLYTDKVPFVLAAFAPELAPLVPVVKVVYARLNPVIKEVAKAGISRVAALARDAAPQIAETSGNLSRNAKEKIRNLLPA